jgi:hypothetical protein
LGPPAEAEEPSIAGRLGAGLISGGISLYITGVTSLASSVEEISPPMITHDIGE